MKSDLEMIQTVIVLIINRKMNSSFM